MSDSKYNEAYEKGFDAGVEAQQQACIYDCGKDYDEFMSGYNKCLNDIKPCLKAWINLELKQDRPDDFKIQNIIRMIEDLSISDLQGECE